MEQLKPCPNVLCGSEKIQVFTYEEIWHYLVCFDCNCSTEQEALPSLEEAIAFWNDRPQVVDVDKVVENLLCLRDCMLDDDNIKMLDTIVEQIQNGGYNATAD